MRKDERGVKLTGEKDRVFALVMLFSSVSVSPYCPVSLFTDLTIASDHLSKKGCTGI